MNLFRINPKIALFLLPFIGGALYSFGFPMRSFPHFMGLSHLGLFLLFQSIPLPYGQELESSNQNETPYKTVLLSVLVFSFGYCLFGYSWIPYTLKEFGGIFFPINSIIGALFSLIIVPQFIIFTLFLYFWGQLKWKKTSLASSVSTRNAIFAFLLVVFETYTPQQFPAHIGHTWLQLAPYLGLSPYFGLPIFSYFSYWIVLSFVSWWRVQKFDKMGLLFFSLFLAVNIALPLTIEEQSVTKDINLRLVQANVGNFMKVQSEKGNANSVEEIFKRYKRLSLLPNKKLETIDLVVWPETAYPRLLNTSIMRASPAFIPTIARNVVEQSGAPLLFGGYDKSENNNADFYETEYNAAFLISPNTTLSEVYHKRLLIPFGESLPFGPMNSFFASFIENISFFAKGDRFPVFNLPRGQRFITVICYEILFSGYIRSYLNSIEQRPHFLMNLTNDSWYGDTSEPYQHQFLSHWRSLEYQLPMVRMTNTGITSILFPDGSESKRLEVFKEGILDITLKLYETEPTIYQRWGFLPTLVVVLFTFILCWLLEKFKSPL